MELPDDVWVYIVKYHVSNSDLHDGDSRTWRECVCNFSSVSRRHRQIAIPFLYSSLTFNVNYPGYPMATIHSMIASKHARARALQSCGHLLQYVREYTLVSWSSAGDDLKDYFPTDGRTTHGRDIWKTAYEAVTGLVSQMPGLQCLRLFKSPISSRLHHSASRSPLLESLALSPYKKRLLPLWHDPLEPTISLHIRHLDYHQTQPGESSSLVYIYHLLDHCILNLVSLKITWPSVPHIIAFVSKRPRSLRKLSVEMRHDSPKHSHARALWDLLPHCFKLVDLTIDWDVLTNFGLQTLSQNTIPSLESICGPLRVVQMITSGRPVKRVEVLETMDHESSRFERVLFPIQDIVKCLNTYVQDVKLHSGIESFQDVLTFLFALRTFKSLNHLSIRCKSQSEGEWDMVSGWEFRNTLRNALHELSSLRVFHLRERDEDLQVPICPIAKERDMNDRGHPSLSELLYLHAGLWVWVHRQGWTYNPQRANPSSTLNGF